MIEHFDEIEEASRDEQKAEGDLHRNFAVDERSGLDAAGRQQSDQVEYDARLDDAADRIQKIDEMRPERWAQLDNLERKHVLNAAGRELEDVYERPTPPLFVENMGDSYLFGTYGDGYSYDRSTGETVGNEYGITMNERGDTGQERLFGDDPREALRTYAHEFRHSYQHEQAHRSEIPHFRNLVDDPEKAQSWSENLRPGGYIPPEHGHEAYQNQPVESDARQFADDLVERVYGRI